jgi:uncharacterized protein YndB with AHSA1/START domain
MLDLKRDVASTTDREVVQVRLLDAPRELVWRTWTEAQHVDQWWGPRGFTTQTHHMDVRVGGTWHYVMRHAEYGEFDNLVTYREVSSPGRLVYSHGTSQEPEQFHVTVTFAEDHGRTRLTMHHVWPTAEALQAVLKYNVVEGGKQTVDRLVEHLAKQR